MVKSGNMMEDWGKLIRRLRTERNLTQKELAKLSGVSRGTISQIETTRSDQDLKDSQIAGFARGLKMTPTSLRELRYGKQPVYRRSLDDALREAELLAPVRISVYLDYYSLHAGTGVEPVDYVYKERSFTADKDIHAFRVHGDCLQPIVEDGDIAIIDRSATIDPGDLIACLIDDELHIARFKLINNEPWVENRYGTYKLNDCREAATVIEIIKRVKKGYPWRKPVED